MLEENETFLRNEIFRRKKNILKLIARKEREKILRKWRLDGMFSQQSKLLRTPSMRFLCLANNYNPLLYLMVS